MAKADPLVKIVVKRGFIFFAGAVDGVGGVRTVSQPGEVLEFPSKVARGFINADQAADANDENIKAVKEQLAAAEAERQRIKVQDSRAREAFLALAGRPAAATAAK